MVKNPGGWDRSAGNVDASDGQKRDFGAAGRTYKYNSGDNVRGNRQRSPSAPEPGEKSGFARAAGPKDGFRGK